MLNELADRIFLDNQAKGFHSDLKTPLEFHMLIVSEIAEATEAVRKNAKPFYHELGKPEGEAVELADALIRILDYAGSQGWDMDKIVEDKLAYNRTRPYKHGKKL